MTNYLLYCAARNPEEARKGRWLNILLLGFLVLVLGLILVTLFGPASPFLASDIGLLVLIFGFYLLNRRGYVTVAALALVVITTLAVATAPLVLDLGLALTLAFPAFLVLTILVAGVFLSWPLVFTMVVALALYVVWYYLGSDIAALSAYRAANPDALVAIGTTLPMFLVGAGVLAWLSNQLIGETLRDLRRRNMELETAYAELTVQSEREHSLGASITDLAGRLSGVSARQASGVSTQAESISQVVSVVAELHAAADQIAARAEEVRQSADIALRSVQRGQDLVVRSREAVQRNRAQVEMVIERMNTLGELTTRITRFVNRIHGLSDETHLLALNATIEAAGAGPLGRRFSVVASEVQNLSKRSNEIVDQIRVLIDELQQAGQVTLAATASSMEVADEVERLADEVRGAQEQVVDAVQRTTELVHLISTATSQQTSATAQMTHTMADIAQAADATSHDASALERAIRELLGAAEQLTTTMTRLRIHPLA